MSSPATTPATAPSTSTTSHPTISQKTPQRSAVDHATPSVTTPKSIPTPHAPFLSPAASRLGTDANAQRNGRSPRVVGTPSRAANTVGMTPNVGGKTVPGSAKTPASLGNTSMFQGSPQGIPSSIDSPATLMALESVTNGSASMGLSMSNLGLGLGLSTSMGLTGSVQSTGGSGRLDDTERRRRLEAVTTMVGKRPSRICQEGVERLARGMFQEVDKEESMGEEGNTTYVMAGDNVAVIVEYQGRNATVADKVELQYHGLSETVNAYAADGAAILKRDLTPEPSITKINATLEKFAVNLECLSRMDKLSVPGSNCFEAISGIHTSLQRLYEHERKMAETLQRDGEGDNQENIQKTILCKKSGSPQMQVHQRIGLSLDFWADNHLVPEPKHVDVKTSSDMKASANQQDVEHKLEGDDDTTYSMTIECEHSSPAFYPPIRNSDDWLSESISKPRQSAPENIEDGILEDTLMPDSSSLDQVLDWLEPSPPLVATVEPDPLSTNNSTLSSTHPQARFVAYLHPPICLPQTLAVQILGSVGVDISQESTAIQQSTHSWDAIVLPPNQLTEKTSFPEVQQSEMFPSRHIENKHSIPKFHDFPTVTADDEVDWTTNLYVPSSSRSRAARIVHSIPFHHPRQIVEILPVLRQWAFFTRILQKCFPGKISTSPTGTTIAEDSMSTGNSAPPNPSSDEEEDDRDGDDDAMLNDLLAPNPTAPPPRVIDISLHIPSYTVQEKQTMDTSESGNESLLLEDSRPALTFSIPKVNRLHRIKLDIGPNAEVSCTMLDDNEAEMDGADQHMTGEETNENEPEQQKRERHVKRRKVAAQSLAISEDIIIWAEWVRQHLLKLG